MALEISKESAADMGGELIERVCETVNQLLKLVDNVPMSYDQLRLLASEHTLLDLGCVHILLALA